jgi:RimJ/RimL family protein N-acetyltransferase
MAGNSRRLDVPLDPAKATEMRAVVACARQADEYRLLTFVTPWPEEFAEDEWELLRVMSTDEPAGDGEHEEEVWDEARMVEYDALREERGATKLCAIAQHVPSGRAVAMTEILVCEDEAHQSWQLITVVHPEHRGHRLGLAVKLANLDLLAEHSPGISFVLTGNAAVNAPMIAVNDMMGFRIVGEGMFWQKRLGSD